MNVVQHHASMMINNLMEFCSFPGMELNMNMTKKIG